MGKFIVIDGLDGSGKGTQTDILVERLKSEGKRVKTLSFPVYESDSSLFVRMYLDGKFGKNPSDTNAYAASMFFACDRYISYKTDWIRDIEDPDTYVIANRYTSANAVHQLSKLPAEDYDGFLEWLFDLEYGKMGLPAPDLVLYLCVPPEVSEALIKSRSSQTGRETDIHENDKRHLSDSYKAALYSAEKLGWKKIDCARGPALRTREDIHKEILRAVEALLSD